MQGTAAALVPATKSKSGIKAARQVADRLFVWNTIVGLLLGVTQFLALPILTPLFSTLPEVQQAVRVPALLSSILHVVNGPVFAGEGILLGLSNFRDLMIITTGGIATMVACLTSPLAKGLEGILGSFLVFTTVQAIAVLVHYLKIGPLANVSKENKA
jgi:Na+-driven multidrug efflux pump